MNHQQTLKIIEKELENHSIIGRKSELLDYQNVVGSQERDRGLSRDLNRVGIKFHQDRSLKFINNDDLMDSPEISKEGRKETIKHLKET